MAANKVEMSLDDIIKSSKAKPGVSNKRTFKKKGTKPGPIKKRGFKGQKEEARVTPATKQLVNKLVQQALAKRGIRNSGSPVKKPFRKVNANSRVIKKRTGPRTETVIVKKIQRPVQKPRVIREVIVQEQPRRVNRPVRKTFVEQRPRQRVVYVNERPTQRGRFVNRRRRSGDSFYESSNFLQRI
ncbi:unnamed protein product [Bursaphelenchus okinawaensis]|uniref:Uncharacterized protein n=1 Tax=Bursaphelenchus okinawaensis TaxID=465554 RepID=A0A811LQH4_9BILA|nr:unnamed protein product [Bursaphelenchus okinawaensis]CAG9125813.1 unnamed protein product [Bursaphelenchus okinawaensis]